MMDASEEHSATRWRARPWRGLAMLGGLTLAVAFFLPAVRGCNSDIVPAEELAGIIKNDTLPDWGDVPQYLMCFCAFLSPYLAGLMLAVAAAGRGRGSPGWSRVVNWCILGLTAGSAGALLVAFVDEVVPFSWPGLGEWRIWLINPVGPLVVLLYLVVARAARDRFSLCPVFIASLWMFCWFGGWVTLDPGSIRWGMVLSFAGAGLLLVATVGEARALTGLTWRRAIGQLLIARLPKPLEARGRCPKCEYLLYGLSEMRCPECGRVFRFEELGVSAEEMGFRMSSVDTRTSSG